MASILAIAGVCVLCGRILEVTLTFRSARALAIIPDTKSAGVGYVTCSVNWIIYECLYIYLYSVCVFVFLSVCLFSPA